MKSIHKYLVLGVMASIFICGSGYAAPLHEDLADLHEEIQGAIQQQHFPYKVIKPMDTWLHNGNAALFGYLLKRQDYEAIKKLKLQRSDDLQVAKPGQLIELIGIARTMELPQFGTTNAVTIIRIKGELDCTYVDNEYFSSCTVYVGIGNK